MFPTRERQIGLCGGFFFEKAVFPFSRGKNRISQGVENRGSLISVPLALRELVVFGPFVEQRRHGRNCPFKVTCAVGILARLDHFLTLELSCGRYQSFWLLCRLARQSLTLLYAGYNRFRGHIPLAMGSDPQCACAT